MYMGGDLCKRLSSNPSLKLTSAMNLTSSGTLLPLAVLHMAVALLLLVFPPHVHLFLAQALPFKHKGS